MQERLRELRLKHKLTQIKVSQYLGCCQSTYSDYEYGKIFIPVTQLIKLAELYQVSLDYLLGLTDETSVHLRI